MNSANDVRSDQSAGSGRAAAIAAEVFRWLGRAAAVALVLFWGAFFIAHINEWYLRTDGRSPPAWVSVQMVFHAGMLIGLLALVRWDRLGATIALAASGAFCIGVAMHARQFPYVVLLNLAPIACVAASHVLLVRKRQAQRTAMKP